MRLPMSVKAKIKYLGRAPSDWKSRQWSKNEKGEWISGPYIIVYDNTLGWTIAENVNYDMTMNGGVK